jgi:hypothetical protein
MKMKTEPTRTYGVGGAVSSVPSLAGVRFFPLVPWLTGPNWD